MRGRLTTAPAVIDPATTMGTVCLTASDLDLSQTFYERTLGLRASRPDDATVVLSAPGGPALVELHGDPSARPLERRATGLFHMAVLVPSRVELARSLWRLAVRRWPLDGASDHLVSEALYLSDPDGNGIEIYRDRPREQWPRSDDRLQMATLPLDLDNLLSELDAAGAPLDGEGVAVGTSVGHVHLQVADLRATEEFYAGVLGFEVTVRAYPRALFVSAGGYHHHLGLNTWHSAGSKPPPSGSVGLRDFEVVLPDGGALEQVVGRVRAAGLEGDSVDGGVRVHDPSGIAVVLRAR
ncbi:MAG: VOC family protein [Solirubrobacterales bacterium]|nr:VOC family protein [Solirubrobacterales bacterium]MBV9165521.1 VOC family protein [Solirubrobacterales bacterium]MBV9535156.1 VOC family protein [Solirubrobacterales bacterium]